jgi:hypothetical protein
MKSFFLTVYCQGGLGNQLFQFIIGYILAKKNKMKLRINLDRFNSYDRKFELDNFPEIKKLCIPKIIKHNLYFKIYLYFYHKFIKILKILRIYNYINSFYFLNQKQFEKSPFIFNKNLLQERITKNITIIGYFQSEKYFIYYRKTVLKLFKFSKPNNKLVQDYLYLIKNKNSIALHIRRGDYLSNPKARYFHGVLGADYYKKSISYVNKRVVNPIFFVFSDDIELVKKTSTFLNNEKHIFIDTKSSINDLNLMSNCKHFIIANSSFSWWGAWLSTNKYKIVCAPKKWVKAKISTPDIIPKSWVKI